MLLKDIAREMLSHFTETRDDGPFYKLHYHIWKNINDAFEGKRKVCWQGSLSPFELPPMFDDMINLPIELVISNSAHFAKNYALIDHGSEVMESRDVCSCLRGVTGGVSTGQYPKPDVLLRTSHFCLGGDKIFEIAERKYGVPYYLVNVPNGDIPCAMDYVARQLEYIFHEMEDYLGIEVSQSRIDEVYGSINQTYSNFRKIAALMRHRPTPAKEEDYWSAWMFSFLMGSKEAVELSQDIIDRIEDNIEKKNFPVPKEEYRILLQGWPWIENPIVDWIRSHENVSVIWNVVEYNHPFGYMDIREPLDPKDPFRSLAKRMVLHFMTANRSPESLVEFQYLFLKQNDFDGFISAGTWACMLGMGTEPSVKNFFSGKNYPFIDFGLDCYDKRNFNEKQVKRDLDLFINTITKNRRVTHGKRRC